MSNILINKSEIKLDKRSFSEYHKILIFKFDLMESNYISNLLRMLNLYILFINDFIAWKGKESILRIWSDFIVIITYHKIQKSLQYQLKFNSCAYNFSSFYLGPPLNLILIFAHDFF